MIEVGALQPGDIVDYEIAKKGFTYALLAAGNEDESRFIPPMRGQFYDIVPFWSSTPTVRKVYVVSIPMEKELQFQFCLLYTSYQCTIQQCHTIGCFVSLPLRSLFIRFPALS